jgi:hypothetical protein
VPFFFGPITARSLGFIHRFILSLWPVGFIEESWMAAPQLPLAAFMLRAAGSTRDGPAPFVVLRQSGDTERRIVRQQLARQSQVVVTWAERASARRIVQWQRALALLKAWLSRQTGDPDADAGVQAPRWLIANERSRSQTHGAARR